MIDEFSYRDANGDRFFNPDKLTSTDLTIERESFRIEEPCLVEVNNKEQIWEVKFRVFLKEKFDYLGQVELDGNKVYLSIIEKGREKPYSLSYYEVFYRLKLPVIDEEYVFFYHKMIRCSGKKDIFQKKTTSPDQSLL